MCIRGQAARAREPTFRQFCYIGLTQISRLVFINFLIADLSDLWKINCCSPPPLPYILRYNCFRCVRRAQDRLRKQQPKDASWAGQTSLTTICTKAENSRVRADCWQFALPPPYVCTVRVGGRSVYKLRDFGLIDDRN